MLQIGRLQSVTLELLLFSTGKKFLLRYSPLGIIEKYNSKGQGFNVKRPEFSFCLYFFSILTHWAGPLPVLNFSFLICKVGLLSHWLVLMII